MNPATPTANPSERSNGTEERKEAPLGQKVERGEHESELQKPLPTSTHSARRSSAAAFALPLARASTSMASASFVAIAIALVVLGQIAHVLALAPEGGRKAGANIEQMLADFFRLEEGPLIIRFGLGDDRGGMRPVRCNRQPRPE